MGLNAHVLYTQSQLAPCNSTARISMFRNGQASKSITVFRSCRQSTMMPGIYGRDPSLKQTLITHCDLIPAATPKICSVNAQASTDIPDNCISLVLLAGGVGKRMGAAIPKQYLELRGKPIATYSMTTFGEMPEIGEIIIVCEPDWREVFEKCYASITRQPPLKFAKPGAERQDSVFNGLQEVRDGAALVAVHDSARPLITASDARACFRDAMEVGAAVLGVPVKPTIKEVDSNNRVVKTLKRSVLWEVQTPQVIRPELLKAGFELVARENLEVTDDVSIVEALGEPVLITPGAYTNIKVTTPDDMSVAERFLEETKS